MSLRTVLLPAPEGPVRKTNSPRLTWNETSSIAGPPRGYCFVTWEKRIIGSLERLLEVGDEVADVLEPDAEAQEPVGDPDPGALGGGHLGVRGVARLAHERVHAAEARRVGDHAEPAEEPFGRLAAAGELECEHPAEAVEDLAGDLVVLV